MEEYNCNHGYCVKRGVVCDYSNDCLDNSDELSELCHEYTCRCDFEGGSTCYWQQDVDDDTDWVIMRASTNMEGIFPPTDHTLGTDEGILQ